MILIKNIYTLYIYKKFYSLLCQENNLPRWIGQQAADRRHIQGGIAADSQSQNSFEFDLQ